MSKHRIRLSVDNEDSFTELVAPEGYEFTGEYRAAKANEYYLDERLIVDRTYDNGFTRGNYFILRPVSTPKERRAEALQNLFKTSTFTSHIYLGTDFLDAIESIFSENPDEVTR